MARGTGERFAGVTGVILAAAGVPLAVYAALMLERGSESNDAPFWIFAVYAGIALVMATALWAFAALLIKRAWGGKDDVHN